MQEFFDHLLGLSTKDLNWWQMAIRCIIVFLMAIAILQPGDKRFLGKNTPFDIIVALMWGSLLSRAITGTSPFIPTMVAGAVLIAVHWILASLAERFHIVGHIIKGKKDLLIKGGEFQWETMKKYNISEEDVMESLRTNGKLEDPKKVKEAYLERNGSVSVLKYPEKKVEILEIKVESGVQIVRIEITQ